MARSPNKYVQIPDAPSHPHWKPESRQIRRAKARAEAKYDDSLRRERAALARQHETARAVARYRSALAGG